MTPEGFRLVLVTTWVGGAEMANLISDSWGVVAEETS